MDEFELWPERKQTFIRPDNRGLTINQVELDGTENVVFVLKADIPRLIVALRMVFEEEG